MEVSTHQFRDGTPVASPPQSPARPAAPASCPDSSSGIWWTWVIGPGAQDHDRLVPLLHERAGVDELAARHLLDGGTRGVRRPSLRHRDDTTALSLRVLSYDDTDDAVESDEEWFLVRANQVVSITPVPDGSRVTGAGRPWSAEDSPVPVHTVADLLHLVLLRVTAEYEEVHRELEIDYDEVETSVFSPARTADAQRIYQLKREVAETRRAVTPLVELLERQLPHDPVLHPWCERPGAREVLERLHRVSEGVDVLDELLLSVLSAHVARVSSQQNDDMRRISAGAALIVVPTLLAGIWGMNFSVMPELGWRWGYPMALGSMALSVTGLWIAFRRSGWF